MPATQFLGGLALKPQFRLGCPTHWAGTVSAGVVQPDAVIPVGTFVNVIALGRRPARPDVPRRTAAARVEPASGIDCGKMIFKYALDYSRFHRGLICTVRNRFLCFLKLASANANPACRPKGRNRPYDSSSKAYAAPRLSPCIISPNRVLRIVCRFPPFGSCSEMYCRMADSDPDITHAFPLQTTASGDEYAK